MALDATAASAATYHNYRGPFTSQESCEFDRAGNPAFPPEFYNYPCAWYNSDPQPWKDRGYGWYWLRVYVDDEPGPPRSNDSLPAR